ncbi:Histidine kinase [Rhodovastum atsumiense]|uniref:ATP-binding protein n=1 Tax=Rhodovastum atsumiense TaxID=504468 RepID=UPI00139F2C79|nr:ATP-binding protein [Rhodovastum atsumiense]CAH2601770.1 Histidine kinase [Rhodovastum atsumiense]
MRLTGPAPPGSPDPFSFSGGEMGSLIRAKGWQATTPGAIARWPATLRTTVEIMLGSRYAMWMGWGKELTFFYNDAYRPTLGVKHPWALGSPAREVWAEIWDTIGPRIDHVLRTGEATYDEGLRLILERSGFPEETFHTFSYSPLPDGAGGVGGMLCVVTEDTRRVIGERRLALLRELGARALGMRSPEAFFGVLAECLGERNPDLPFSLVYTLAPDGKAATLACCSGIGRDHPAAPATIALADGGGGPWELAEVLARGRGVEVDDLSARFRDLPGGPWRKPPARALVLPIAQQGQSRCAGFLVAALNPYRPLDEEYRGFIELLAGQVAAGLADARAYAEERRRAEALAELDRAKTTFFSNVSHEFRTPLTLMLGPIEEVLATDAAGSARPLLELAHRNGLRLLRLVNTLLDFSRVEAGRVQASYEPVELGTLTASLAANFRSACERAGLGLEVDCPRLPEPVFVDRDMWEKIVLNLLSNAFKFTLAGGIAVSLRWDGQGAELAVRDSGIGIPEAELPRLFERFHRVEGAAGRTMEGSGIGLALVQELVRLHGGGITVESTPGRGSTFRVTIPAGTAHLPAERIGARRSQVSTAMQADAFVEEALRWLPAAAGEALPARNGPGWVVLPEAGPPEEEEVRGPRPRVLLADDNADVRDYLRRLLEGRYEVAAVPDGAAALAVAEADPPDLVLTDVMMPRLDGFGLLRALRARPRTRDLPVIMLSARAGEEARIDGLEAGADDYLAKPFSARELLARVRANLELARIRREASAELRAWRGRYEAAVRASGHVLFDWDAETETAVFGDELERILGWRAQELGEKPQLRELIHPEDRAALRATVAHAAVTGEPFRHECRLRHRDGVWLDAEVHGNFVRDPLRRGRHMVGFIRDVTERKRAEARQRLLIDELNHRVKNTLAAVQSIATQTLRSRDPAVPPGESFISRLMSLAQTHDLLTRTCWEGATLRDLLQGKLAPWCGRAGAARVACRGPHVRLGPKAVQALGMAFHELAANAATHGALSNETGQVEVSWTIVPDAEGERQLRLLWAETGGPVPRLPVRRGFGARLIEGGLAKELHGEAQLRFDSTGLRCMIAFPLDLAGQAA